MRARGRLLDGDSRHGTTTGHDYWGCRCEQCRLAANAASRERKRKRAGVNLPSYDERHGTTAGYNAGCRCDQCGQAISAYNAARSKQKRTTGGAA